MLFGDVIILFKDVGSKTKGGEISGSKWSRKFREPTVSYGVNFTPENGFFKASKHLCFG
jgi:hypothetical protein